MGDIESLTPMFAIFGRKNILGLILSCSYYLRSSEGRFTLGFFYNSVCGSIGFGERMGARPDIRYNQCLCKMFNAWAVSMPIFNFFVQQKGFSPRFSWCNFEIS